MNDWKLKVKKRKILVIQLSSYKGWVIDGMLKDAATAIGLRPRFVYYPESKRKFLLRFALKFFVNNSQYELNVFGNHKTYFAITKAKKEKRERIFVTQVLPEDHLFESADKDSLRKIEKIIVQNNAVRDYLVTLGIDCDRIVRNPGGVDRSLFYPLKHKEDIKDYVLISGSFKYRKNTDLICDVMYSCPQIDFKIHGLNLELFSSYSGENLELIDFNFENQPALMRHARLHLVLSRWEGGPMSILESLASGTPCVSTDVGFARELITKKSGVIIPKLPMVSEATNAVLRAWEMKYLTYDLDLLKNYFLWSDFANDLFN